MTKKTAMISSTSHDLPEHRKQVMDACSRAGFIPLANQQVPARLTNAKQILIELGATYVITKLEAELPPFDESKFDPMPDVEINPKDEYWVDPDSLSSET